MEFRAGGGEGKVHSFVYKLKPQSVWLKLSLTFPNTRSWARKAGQTQCKQTV